MASQYRQFILFLPGNLAEHQTLSRIVQDRLVLVSYLLQNPVAEPAKAEHVNIHNGMVGVL